ncbi:MAG: plasmid pRiA4b ORF-3 family protein [Actinomycetota bacterium]|nr:plasmid pRiA4b ORF-3 family protein [Actinomycetota bacterium]
MIDDPKQVVTVEEEPTPVRQLRMFVSWLGDGRALTQTGRITLADARELVMRLDTGDQLDPMGGRFKTKSSSELPGLALIVEWAKACRLVRVSRGRLVPVKKNAVLCDQPEALGDRMLEVFGLLGAVLCPAGWAESLTRRHFSEVVAAVFDVIPQNDGSIPTTELHELAWEIVSARYRLDGLTDEQHAVWRAMNDRDLGHALLTLEQLGVLRCEEGATTLTERGLTGLRRARGEGGPTDAVLQLKIGLIGVAKPPVWRRVLVPAQMRLDRFHEVVQVAMGWVGGHMHVFSAGGVEYGFPDPELGHRDERKTTLDRVLVRAGDRMRYTYDFGDDWEHEILVEKVHVAEPGRTYPACVDGRSRCPPEDCGGPWGYADLRAVLADPGHDEHAEMLEWLGIVRASEFDPGAFDLAEVNAALT